jgi:hypothetical protein
MAKKLTGRPPVIIDPKQIEQLASLWLTKEATADFLGVGRSTLFDKLRTETRRSRRHGTVAAPSSRPARCRG